MKKQLLLICVLIACISAKAQNRNVRPCTTNPIYRFFDFWIGEWEAFGKDGKKAGDSRISVLLDSCVIFEEWTGAQGGYAGKSFNTYNTQTKMWQQTWVDNKGGITEYNNSTWEKNKMIVTTNNLTQPNGTTQMLRMTFTKLDEHTVRQFGETSADGGHTWTTSFDLEYRRKK